jgi:hypothetical protein
MILFINRYRELIRLFLILAMFCSLMVAAHAQVDPLPPNWFEASPVGVDGYYAPRPLAVPDLPIFSTQGLTSNVASTGTAGFSFPCTGTSDCGWFIFQQPTTPDEDDVPSLRVQRSASYLGGSNGAINPTIWALTSSAPAGLNNEWSIISQLQNVAHAQTFTVNIAVNGTAAKTNPNGIGGGPQPTTVTISNGGGSSPGVVTWTGANFAAGDHFKFYTTGALPSPLAVNTWYYVIAAGLTANSFEISASAGGAAINTSTAGSGVQSATYEVGSTDAGNFNCVEQTALSDPLASCAGLEVDINTVPGAGTDVHKQRVGMELAAGVEGAGDAGVHVGRGLWIVAQQGAVLDNAIEIQDTATTDHFIVHGDGSTVLASSRGNWSSANFSPDLAITSAGVSNPSLALQDVSNLNPWAMEVDSVAGVLGLYTMPALTNTGTAPTLRWSVDRSGNVVAGATFRTAPVTIAQLLAITCNSTTEGASAFVKDTVGSAAPSFDLTVAAGGAATVNRSAWCNGTVWKY